ncbi:MAG: ATP-binding protein, partial [Thermoplasmata archaeon]
GGSASGVRLAFRRFLALFRRTRPPPEDFATEVQADIGDRVAAIKFLADTQGPWKALLEQVENAIDEYPEGYPIRGPIEVRIVKRGAGSYIVIRDRGRGFVPDKRGLPDFEGVATRVAKSFKGRLADYRGAQGEFAVGLFGFRTIGREIVIESTTDYAGYPHRTRDYRLPRRGRSPTYTMTIDGESLTARIAKAEVQRREAGTTIAIRKLLNPRIWTAAKVKKAVEEAMWDRLVEKGLTIRVSDGRQSFQVVPKARAFEGALFPTTSLATPYGPIRLELYVLEKEDPKAAIPVLRAKEHGSGATRVYRNLTALDEFRGPPWNLRRVQGWIRYDAATLSGPTRAEFFQDERYHAFVEALKGLEEEVAHVIEIQDAQRERRGLRRILKELRGDLERVCRELPHLDIFRIARDRPDSLYIAPPAGVRRDGGRRRKPVSAAKGAGGRPRPRRRSLIGLPPPTFVVNGVAWRSRYLPAEHLVEINKGHPDYERESVTHRRWYRYLLKLYTKELVLECYHGSEEEGKLLEATIEAQIRAEQDL